MIMLYDQENLLETTEAQEEILLHSRPGDFVRLNEIEYRITSKEYDLDSEIIVINLE